MMILLVVLILCCVSQTVAFAPTTRRVFLVPPTTTSALYFLDDDNQETKSVSSSPVVAPLWKLLDLNEDGKVDAQDLVWLANHALDVNGDGKIDRKDGQAALSMVLLSWMLMVSPVQAKGGGHGGGGGGGHTYYHSSPNYYSSPPPPHYESFKRPTRPFRELLKPSSKLEDLNACYDLPVSGELVDVLVDSQSGKYVSAVVSSVKETRCSFEASIVGGGKRFQYPAHKILTTPRNWMVRAPEILIDVGFGAWGLVVFSSLFSACYDEYENSTWDRDFDSEFDGLQNANDDGLKLPPPFSGVGKFEGSTMESDGADQDVQVKLTFRDDGSITGEGNDSVDGHYTVVGTWAENRVTWTEQYEEGFATTVRGEILPDKSIQCRFVSTRNIRGEFTIRKKIFGLI